MKIEKESYLSPVVNIMHLHPLQPMLSPSYPIDIEGDFGDIEDLGDW